MGRLLLASIRSISSKRLPCPTISFIAYSLQANNHLVTSRTSSKPGKLRPSPAGISFPSTTARKMHPSISTCYIIPAILLNPVIFLHGMNTILSRILPPVVAASPIQPPAYSAFGPAALHQHVDVQSSENLCWTYTIFMICAQLLAYNNVSLRREEHRESRSKNEGVAQKLHGSLNGNTSSRLAGGTESKHTRNIIDGTIQIRPTDEHWEARENYDRPETATTSDSEIVL